MDPNRLRTIVYVDDEPDIREIVQLSLGLIPTLDVHCFESGERALEAIPAIRPDMVLLDVMMPGLDGPGTLNRLRSQPALAKIPVVFMTAKAMPHETARFQQLGAASVIAKPFDPMALGRQVQKIWEELPDER